ncbi:MAG: sugar phosphate isomerase/epimerase [Cyclobacteriaceae bacterium]|nr:sugar phosphate isomerase/epimerase [Cyclobacteriaceae bacterium]
MKSKSTRRQFIGTASALVAGSLLSSQASFGMPNFINNLGKKGSTVKGVRLGLITYSFRDLPDQSAEATLEYIRQCGITNIELMGGPAESFAGAPKNPVNFSTMLPIWRKRQQQQELTEEEKQTLADVEAKNKIYRAEISEWRQKASMTKFEEFGKMYKKAGIDIYAFKPDAFGMQNSDSDIDYGLRAAKALGATHVTLEHPSNDAHTLKLGKAAEKYGMKIGYHGHEQQTPTFWDTALSQSPANALNLDFGHYIAAGNTNALEFVKAKSKYIVSMHMKDRKSKANGGDNLPWGTGDTPLADVLRLMRDNKYTFPATIELEYKVPEGSSPIEEVKKCLEFCKSALG